MKLKIILTGIGLFFVALIGVAFTVVMATDFNDYRDLVQERMKAATGRDLVIAGDVDVSFSLSPRLTAKQVSFRNADWSDIPQMAALDEIEAEVALLPLMSGAIKIRDVVLRGGQVVVETSKEGVGNWVLDLAPTTPSAENATTTASGLPAVDRLTIENVALVYRDGEAGTRHDLNLDQFAAEDAPGTGIKVAIKGAWNDRLVDLSGIVGAPRQFTEGPLPLDLKGTLADVALGLKGEIGDPTKFSDIALAITSSGPSLSSLGAILGVDLPKSKAYTLALQLTGGGDRFTASDATATVGGSDATGNLVIDTAKEVAIITATLSSQRVDFADLGLDEDTTKTGGDGRLFSAEPWPVGALSAVHGEITWPIGTLVRGGASADDVAFSLALKNGAATLKYVKAKIAGGSVAASGTLKPAKAGHTLAMKLDAKEIESAPLLSMMGLDDVLTVGRVTINLDVNGPGTSMRDLMAGLNGSANFASGSGQVRNSFARLLLANLFGLLIPGSGDGSRITCVAGTFNIKSGLATTRGTVVDTPSAIVVGAGNINLRDEQIDMRVDPKSKDIGLSTIAVPVRVTGPLADPHVIPDPVATVGNTVNFATGTVNVATLGIFGALTGLGEGDGSTNSCAAAVGSALSGKAQPSTTETVLQGIGSAAEDVGEGAADVLQGVGEGIGDLFGQ